MSIETVDAKDIQIAKQLSPRRKTSTAVDIEGLVVEQLEHFGIEPASGMGQTLGRLVNYLFHANVEMQNLWDVVVREIESLDRSDRIAYFNAKKFLCFQLAKLLDTLQNPMRHTYQSIVKTQSGRMAKGAYPIFDNVSALFSATPVITKTATYLYACTEWIDDAFHGREMLLEVYSRLLNPTSTALANHIVDLECGPLAKEYMAWNFNSGMAAVDATLSNVLGHRDVVLCSRNVYGGVFQLLEDWFHKPSNLDVGIHWFDGYTVEAYREALARTREQYADRLAEGRQIYVYIESPCNPHGYVLDVPAICAAAHAEGLTVILDATVATPFLCQPLQRKDPAERPDFVIHSYTKDICGTGTATAGVCIARNERMFIPKGDSVTTTDLSGNEVTYPWNESLFWNVFYIKGAFLDADKAFEVLTGSHTLELRMLRKIVNTKVLAQFFDAHSQINVRGSVLDSDENAAIRKKVMLQGFAAPLFTIDMEGSEIDRQTFAQMFDCLEPVFGHQVSLGQSNTVVLCPALTSHSEMSPVKLQEAGITSTTIRVSVGIEDPRQLMAHFAQVCKLIVDPQYPGFSDGLMDPQQFDRLYRETYLEIHSRWLESQPTVEEIWE